MRSDNTVTGGWRSGWGQARAVTKRLEKGWGWTEAIGADDPSAPRADGQGGCIPPFEARPGGTGSTRARLWGNGLRRVECARAPPPPPPGARAHRAHWAPAGRSAPCGSARPCPTRHMCGPPPPPPPSPCLDTGVSKHGDPPSPHFWVLFGPPVFEVPMQLRRWCVASGCGLQDGSV